MRANFYLSLIIFLLSNQLLAIELPSTTELLVKTGIELYENGDYEGSLKLFDSGLDSIDDDETKILIHKYLALNYIAFNVKEKAYQEFKKIFFIKPDFQLEERFSPVVMEVFEKAKRDSFLIGTLEILSEPENANVFIDGRFAGKTPFKKEMVFGRYFIEIRLFGYITYSKSLVLNSEEMSLGKIILKETDFYSRFKEGMAFYKDGDFDTALDIFFDVIPESREFPDPYIMIGICYSKMPEMEYEGIEWIKRGIAKSPEKVKGYQRLFDAYMIIEDYKAALSTLEMIESLDASQEIGEWVKDQRSRLAELGYK